MHMHMQRTFSRSMLVCMAASHSSFSVSDAAASTNFLGFEPFFRGCAVSENTSGPGPSFGTSTASASSSASGGALRS